jgi:hypothetical protein
MAARDRGADCDNLPFAVNVHVSQSRLSILVKNVFLPRLETRLLLLRLTIAPTYCCFMILYGRAFHGRSIKAH